jgi:uncharacterized protein
MKIWIDLVNSPQVLFFRPIIDCLKSNGHSVLLTTRDYAQTIPLADSYGLEHIPIGIHGGKKWASILQISFGRVYELVRWARNQGGIDLASSHNSYTQSVAASLLRIPFVTLMDYEFQPLNQLSFRLAQRVIVPEPFPNELLKTYGCSHKTYKYAGIKENLYLANFSPDSEFLERQGIPKNRIIVVIRPPAPWTAYHRFENTLFDQVLKSIAENVDTFIVFLPRIFSQGEAIRALGYSNVWIPEGALDGPNMIYAADLVISGGGTMNREAAVLGTSVYTVFKGKMGAVDKYLMDQGLLTQISDQEDIPKILIQKRHGHHAIKSDPALVGQVTNLILGAVKN